MTYVQYINGWETIIKREIQEEDVTSQSESNVLDDDCDVAVTREIQSEISSPDFGIQKEGACFTKHPNPMQIKSETITCSNSCNREIDSQKDRKFLADDPEKYNSDREMNKIEIKEQPWWQQREASSVSDDIKDGDVSSVQSPRLTTISNNSSTEVDSKMEIKQEGLMSNNIASQNGRKFFTKNFTMVRNNDSALLQNDCDIAIKSEIKFEASQPECSSNYTGQIKSEAVSCSDMINDERGVAAKKEKQFVPEDAAMEPKNSNTGNKTGNKIEIREEQLWPVESEPSVCDVKNENVSAVKFPRLHTETIFGNFGYSPVTSTSASTRNNLLTYGNNYAEFENQEREVTVIPATEKHVDSEQSGNCGYSKNQRSHRCKICDSSFTHLSALKAHMARRLHKCDICKKSFIALSSLKRHILLHKDAPYHCEICEMPFTRMTYLRLHEFVHRGEKPYKCEVCDKSFAQLANLQSHNLTHETITCNICYKVFTELSALKSHQLIHEDNKPPKCEICNKRFTLLKDLKSHILRHEGKKFHSCNVCKKNFIHLSSLKSHMLVHEAKNAFKCEICGQEYSQLSSLKLHTLTHEGNEAPKCEICGKEFPLLSALKRHYSLHEEAKPYKCEICGKQFHQLPYLKAHTMIHKERKPHTCEVCNKSFAQATVLKSHMMAHEGKKPHKCEFCGKSFTWTGSLKLHIMIHKGERPHQCEVCGKKFTNLTSLKKHNLIHEGNRPHKCPLCGKKFAQLSDLKLHSLLHGKEV